MLPPAIRISPIVSFHSKHMGPNKGNCYNLCLLIKISYFLKEENTVVGYEHKWDQGILIVECDPSSMCYMSEVT